jgi:hypothetical protein
VIPSKAALVSLTHAGKRRWMDPEPQPVVSPSSTPEWRIVSQGVIAEGTTPWVIGTEQLFGDEDPSERHRVAIQRRTSRGEPEGTIRRSFVEAEPESGEDVPARSTCPSSDAIRPPQLGSQAAAAAVGADGSLLLAGRQGCRDSFLMRLEVLR